MKVLWFLTLQIIPQTKRKKLPLIDDIVKATLSNNDPCSFPVGWVEILDNKIIVGVIAKHLYPKVFHIVAFIKDVMDIFYVLAITVAVRGHLNSPVVEKIVSRELVMVKEPHEVLNFVRDWKFPTLFRSILWLLLLGHLLFTRNL